MALKIVSITMEILGEQDLDGRSMAGSQVRWSLMVFNTVVAVVLGGIAIFNSAIPKHFRFTNR